MKHKTLCIYVFHIYNERVKYFIENVIYKNDAWKREEIIFVKGNRIKCPLS